VLADEDRTLHGDVNVAPPMAAAADHRLGMDLAAYRIEAVIGRGGMGVVYRARHRHLQRTAAVKVLAPEFAHTEDVRERFLRESRAAAAMEHPNIVAVYDAGEFEGELYIAMQYVEGEDLAAILAREGRLTVERTLGILGQVADALDAAHAQGLIHRDVKPGNVLLDSRRAYLSDFGLTKRITSGSALTRSGDVLGTIDFLAPEQVEGLPNLDGRTDVYALGCVMYSCLAGSPPYQRDSDMAVLYAHVRDRPPSIAQLRPELPAGLDAVMARAMAKKPRDRYRTCGEMIAAARSESSLIAADERHADAVVVLVADPESANRGLLRAALAGTRIEVVDAQDAAAAKELATVRAPQLVFVSTAMTGWEALLPELRALGGKVHAKVVLIQRRGAVLPRDPGQELFDDQLRAPFSPLQVLVKVRDLLGQDTIAT